MSIEDSLRFIEGEPDPSEPVSQETILAQIQAKFMAKLVVDRELLDAVRLGFQKFHKVDEDSPHFLALFNGESRMFPHRSGGALRNSEGNMQEIESIGLGLQAGPMGTMSFVYLARRPADSIDLLPEHVHEGFTLDQAQFVLDALDELKLAQVSGQIPNLNATSLDYIVR